MYVYLATGTPDFMEILHKKYKKENMTLLYDTQQAILMHITEKKSKFATPSSFEVLKEVNEFQDHGFYTITYIDTFDDNQISFKDHLMTKNFSFINEPGFVAYKLLGPVKSAIFAIIQQWTGVNSYEAWKASSSYAIDYDFMFEDSPADRRPTAFSVAPYTKKLMTAPPEKVETEEDEF